MKVLFLNYSDRSGGAAIAAFRLFTALPGCGVEPWMLVDNKVTAHPRVAALPHRIQILKMAQRDVIRRWLTWRYPQRIPGVFSLSPWPDGTRRVIAALAPDILHLHWTGFAFLNLNILQRLRRPVIWTMHDMMPFTGGCHYDSNCGRYTQGCGQCPELGSRQRRDASSGEWRRKQAAVRSLPLIMVSPSRWLAECARKSLLFRDRDVRIIPYGIDVSCFRPRSKAQCREILGLPLDKPLLLFGAFGGTSDPRKGFAGLSAALDECAGQWGGQRPDIVILGQSESVLGLPKAYRTHLLGTFRDEVTLALVYAAADLFVAPSRQDNLPNTIMEALACGTPVISFDVGGIPDLVEHQGNGYLAKAADTNDLIQGIMWALADPPRLQALGNAAREKVVREFTDSLQASRYERLYAEIAAQAPCRS